MKHPIFELEVVHEIMEKIKECDLIFYKKELAYEHCGICDILKQQAYNWYSDKEKDNMKRESCTASLSICHGEYLIPLLMNLREKSVEYYSIAAKQLLHQFYTMYLPNSAKYNGSYLEQLFSWMQEFIYQYYYSYKRIPDESELKAVFMYKLEATLQGKNYQKNKAF